MYNNIISTDNLLAAWKEFLKGKKSKKDVQDFQYRLSDNMISLRNDLKNKTYVHGYYHAFKISDPKPRDIHKATVRDRLLHRAIYRVLYPYFDPTFIYDSYSCRKNRGTHRALKRFRHFSNIASKNYTKTLWILKCDIKKFFASVDQKILVGILERSIQGRDVTELVQGVVKSFPNHLQKGLPLGNLTSQLLVNIYMNKFDHFMKHIIKARYYIRYADDFVIMNTDKDWLINIVPMIQKFLADELALQLHPRKLSISTLSSGVDFLGWVHLPDHKVLRTSTKKRMFKNLEIKKDKVPTAQSYLGLLSHGNTHRLREQVKNSMV